MTKVQIWRIFAALLVALAMATTVTAVVYARRDGDPRWDHRVSVLIVGDSFTAGVGPTVAYPERVARDANWDLHVDAQGATGFIADGKGTGNGDTSRLIDRLAEDGRKFPNIDLLIIDAGRNDLNYPTDQIVAALSEYLTHARRQWPDAKIVEIFPAFVKSVPFDTYPDLLDKMTARLAAVHGTLIDPFAEGWYTDADLDSLVIDDKVHPNPKGNAYIADRLIESLRREAIVAAT